MKLTLYLDIINLLCDHEKGARGMFPQKNNFGYCKRVYYLILCPCKW